MMFALFQENYLLVRKNDWTLKIVAMVAMVFDHTTLVGVAGDHWMTFHAIGRLVFPIFAYQVATGFYRISGRKKYLRNL